MPDPQLLFPEVSQQKCRSCMERLRDLKWRREDAKAIHFLNETELIILALRDRIFDLLSLFEFDRVEGILEEIKKLLSPRTEVDERA